jgi:hypothetical protein
MPIGTFNKTLYVLTGIKKGSCMKILIIEDEQELANALYYFLRKEIYICEMVSTFQEADRSFLFIC